jgi:hypothetical protein
MQEAGELETLTVRPRELQKTPSAGSFTRSSLCNADKKSVLASLIAQARKVELITLINALLR